MILGRMFWKLTRYARAARFWVLLALAALAWLGFGEARAACVEVDGPNNVRCDTRAEAYAFAESLPSPYPVGTSAGTCNSFRGGTGSPPNYVVWDDPWNSYGAILYCQNRDYTGPRI